MNDVFISYASQDREWAARMAAALRGRGMRVFFDRDSLRDGDDWATQIRANVLACKHIVCFWSAHAHDSPWVQNELAMFRVGSPRDGKLFMISLDAPRNAFTNTQQLDIPAVRSAYSAGGPNAMSNQDWIALADRVQRDVQANGASLQVLVALLTLDKTLLRTLDKTAIERVERDLGLSENDIARRYGDRRLDWKPFTNGDSIEDHLEKSRNEINAWLATARSTPPETMAWEFPSEFFWSEDGFRQRIREFAGRMESGQPGLIIIDPIAAPHLRIQLCLGFFTRCLRLSNVTIIVPHPSAATQEDASFRDWLTTNTTNLLYEYVEPLPIPESPIAARFGIGVDEIGEMKRLLKTSLGDVLRRRNPASAPAVAAISNYA